MLDCNGLVISGAMSNVFLVSNGSLVTPELRMAGVAGVMRGIVLRECASLGLVATVKAVTLSDVHAADEVFITNARIGVVPVRRVGEHHYHMNPIHAVAMSPVALRLAKHLETLDA
jgi:branched-subunit amino acid aminotransferase/4-amino-4-deoxychorismate lyase